MGRRRFLRPYFCLLLNISGGLFFWGLAAAGRVEPKASRSGVDHKPAAGQSIFLLPSPPAESTDVDFRRTSAHGHTTPVAGAPCTCSPSKTSIRCRFGGPARCQDRPHPSYSGRGWGRPDLLQELHRFVPQWQKVEPTCSPVADSRFPHGRKLNRLVPSWQKCPDNVYASARAGIGG